jgi:tetratricopeptide (TPR) repeat protein
MATPEEQAVALKNQGNKAFAAHDWQTAIDFYTKAIELNDKEPTYWSNRAQVRAVSKPSFPSEPLRSFGRVTDKTCFCAGVSEDGGIRLCYTGCYESHRA